MTYFKNTQSSLRLFSSINVLFKLISLTFTNYGKHISDYYKKKEKKKEIWLYSSWQY